jgi:hypothetical protein
MARKAFPDTRFVFSTRNRIQVGYLKNSFMISTRSFLRNLDACAYLSARAFPPHATVVHCNTAPMPRCSIWRRAAEYSRNVPALPVGY